MSQRSDDESAQSDPLLLFATEPQPDVAPAPQVEIPIEIEPAQATPELAALVERAETAERLLRESRRDAAALKREVATLVSAAKDNRAQARRSAVTLGLAAACLVALVTIGWRFVPVAAPPTVSAAAPVSEPEAQQPPVESPEFAAETPVAVSTVSPVRREAPARALTDRAIVSATAQERPAPAPQVRYVGTLTIDALPAGGEVFLNRKSVGRSPLRLPGLRAGSHLVWIERAGYRRFTRVVTVPADSVTRVSVALEPETAPAVRP